MPCFSTPDAGGPAFSLIKCFLILALLSSQDCHGGTLVLDQVADSCQSEAERCRGWVVPPRANRALLFRGNRLHGATLCLPHEPAARVGIALAS